MKRRKFVSQTTLATASLMMLRCKAENIQKQVQEKHAYTIDKVGIQLWSVRHLMDQDPKGTLKQLADIGYNDIELTGGCYSADGKFFGIDAQEFKSFIADLGLSIHCSHAPGTGRLETDPNSINLSHNWEAYCEALAGLDVEVVILPYLIDEERGTLDDYKEIVDLMHGCAELAQKHGMQMAYHNHDFEFELIDGVVPYDMMLERCDPQLVNFEMDHYWVAKAHASSVEYIKKYPGRFKYWHVKDMADTEDRFFAPVGSGIIDFPEIFRHAELSGLQHFMIEQDDYRKYEAMQSMDMSHDYIREMKF